MDNDSNWGCGCLCVIIGIVIIAAISSNSGSKSSGSTYSTPTNTYQAPKPTYTPPPPSYNYTPIQTVPRQQIVTREATPDDAYIVKGMMKDMSKGKAMVGTDIVTDTVMMIPVATMIITKPDTKRAMKKDIMRAIVKGSPIMKKPKKMKNPKMNGNK